MISAVLSFLGNILAKIAGPVLAFFAGKSAGKKEVRSENDKETIAALETIILVNGSVDRVADPDKLRELLNRRPE